MFSRLVKDNNGIVPVMVHPFFTGNVDREYAEKRNQFIRACLKNDKPLVIFEEAKEIPQLIDYLAGCGIHFFIVPTETCNPIPYHPEIKDQERNWRQLFATFRAAGVKKLIIGGEYLNFYLSHEIPTGQFFDPLREFHFQINNDLGVLPPTLEMVRQKAAVPWGCVGYALVRLYLAGFKVTLSSVASPCKVIDMTPKIPQLLQASVGS